MHPLPRPLSPAARSRRHPAWASRRLGRAAAAALLLALGACASSPPLQLYQLRADLPPGAEWPGPAISAPAASAAGGRWVLGPVQVPEYLDRDAILVPTGQAGLQALPQQRWAEPLRDALPRLLRMDLARLRGSDLIWAAPAPAGTTVARQLRVEVQRLEASADGQSVQLQARWWLADPAGLQAAQVHDTQLSAPARSRSADDLVAAHRAVLWLLAREIARLGSSGP